MQTIPVQDYTIYVGKLKAALPAFLESLPHSALFVLADSNTEAHCLPLLEEALGHNRFSLIRIPPGEAHKNIDSCQLIWSQLMEQRAGRDALLLNLGGGVIGDMGGFCAGTFKRGIRFIQIPTTLLSQVDASIGGKLGIDFRMVKNSIGLFANPQAVFIDPAFLKTLPAREIRSGYAELIKHSLIADAGQWAQLQQILDMSQADWAGLIPPSLAVKQRIVEEDPFEKGIRKALNFGHTIGHAVEGLALETDEPLLHGEAIAIGMVCEAYLSQEKLGLKTKDVGRIVRYIKGLYGHRPLAPEDFDTYLALMSNDKKNEGRQINFSLISAIGQPVVNQHCEPALIRKSLDFYNGLQTSS